jgi:endonuclease G
MSDRWPLCAKGHFVFLFSALLSVAVPDSSWARLGADYQMQLGNPTAATVDGSNHVHYLIQRARYALDYNDTTHQANWVSWSYTTADSGSTSRQNSFRADTSLPSGFTQIGNASFDTGYDRGHLCPSGDRTASVADNDETFLMSNMIPQASRNNQVLWAAFEGYCRGLASGESEILITCGPGNFGTASISNGMKLPGSVWKVVVVSPTGTALAPEKVTTACRVIAINTPNTATVSTSWTDYITTVEEIEAETGFHFFSSLPTPVARYLRKVKDTGSGPNTPTAITSVNPISGLAGTTVIISGYNFGNSPVVKFNGVTATASVQGGGTQINAVVPASATTGTITVTSANNGADTSAETFTVSSSPIPSPTLSTSLLTGFTSVSGTASASQSYTVSGSNLTSNVVVTAPTGCEVSLDNSTFGGSKTLVPSSGSLSGVRVYVRLSPSAATGVVSGTVVNSVGGATMQNLTVSGAVVPKSSGEVISLANWTFEASLPSNSGPYAPEAGAQTDTAQARSVHITSPTGYSAAGNGSAKSSWGDNWAVGDYYEFRISTLGLNGIQLGFDQTSSSTGPRDFKISYSINGGASFSDLSTYSVPESAGGAIGWNNTTVNPTSSLIFDLSSFLALNNQSSLILRLVCASSTSLSGGSVGITGTSRLDNVIVSALSPDTTAPVIRLNGANPETLVYGHNYVDPATAGDNSGSVATFAVTGRVLSTVVGSYVLTYTATDGSGNVSTATRTVNVVLNASNSTSADSDGNGMSDLLEYALGGSPTGNSLAILPAVQLVGENLQVAFRARTNDPNLTIQPVSNSNLSPTGWSSSNVTKISAVPVLGQEGFETQIWATPVTGTDRKFLKVNITR